MKGTTREEKAEVLVREGRVQPLPIEGLYQVKGSQSYVVNLKEGTCTCPDYARRGGKCKHLLAVERYVAGEGRPVLPRKEGKESGMKREKQLEMALAALEGIGSVAKALREELRKAKFHGTDTREEVEALAAKAKAMSDLYSELMGYLMALQRKREGVLSAEELRKLYF